MQYRETIRLKDGRECLLRNATEQDAPVVMEIYARTHGETDYLASYEDENSFTLEQERAFLKAREESPREIFLLAEIDGRAVGTAGLDLLGTKEKVRHRAGFGISVLRGYWGLGIGRALLRTCVERAKSAGYAQLELDVVADNARAVALYESEGFVEYGRNPRGFRSRYTGWQEMLLMRREL